MATIKKNCKRLRRISLVLLLFFFTTFFSTLCLIYRTLLLRASKQNHSQDSFCKFAVDWKACIKRQKRSDYSPSFKYAGLIGLYVQAIFTYTLSPFHITQWRVLCSALTFLANEKYLIVFYSSNWRITTTLIDMIVEML